MLLNNALVVDRDEVSSAALRRSLMAYGIQVILSAATLSSALDQLTIDTELVLMAAVLAGEACFPILDRMRAIRSRAHAIVINNGATPQILFDLGKRSEVSGLLDQPVLHQSLWRCLDSLGAAGDREHGSGRDTSSHDRVADARARLLETLRKTHRLTNAEVEVLRCAVAAMSQSDIAVRRRVSTNTLKTQVRSLLGKFGAPNLESLAARIRNEAERRNPTPELPAG